MIIVKVDSGSPMRLSTPAVHAPSVLTEYAVNTKLLLSYGSFFNSNKASREE
jgi:hypothetical protein